MRPLAVRVRGLTKEYGAHRALDGIDLSVPEGAVYGFLGPNGAGKTTTLRILSGLSRPSRGEAQVLGVSVAGGDDAGERLPAAALREVGYLPDVPGFYPWMTAREFLRFSGRLFGIARQELDSRVDALLDLSGLSGVRGRIGGFSRGMRQRLGIAQALVNAPRLLMLDEPTSALDPMGRRDVLDMIGSLRGHTTVLFSTHILTDVERVCDTVGILDSGRVVAEGPLSSLTMPRGVHRFVLEVSDGADRIESALRERSWLAGISRQGNSLSLTADDGTAPQREVPAIVSELGLPLVRFETLETSLEEVFLDLVEGGGGGR